MKNKWKRGIKKRNKKKGTAVYLVASQYLACLY